MLSWLFWLLFLPVSLPLYGLRQLWSWRRPFTVLNIQLHGPLLDSPPAGGFTVPEGGTHLFPLLAALQHAERDPRLRTVLVRVRDFRSGLARAEELRMALARVAAAGKRVVLHAEELSLASYWIACGASEVVLTPTGTLNVTGVASEFTLLRGLLNKLGVMPQLSARGQYKSMRELFTEDAMSAANREMLESLVGNLARQLSERIAQGRRLDVEAVRGLLDEGPFRAEQARAKGLIDGLAYEDELIEPLEEDKQERVARPQRYLAVRQRSWLPRRPPRVALLRVSGNIKSGQDAPGRQGPRATGAVPFVKAVRRAAESRAVKAIVLRVDSPGGSALASDVMWRALRRAKEKKPVFVTMANAAASGGYYVSGLPGARIWASACTITGSIGVVAGKFTILELLSKLGVKREIIQSGARAAFYSPTQPWSESELHKLEEDLDAHYRDFVSKMAEGRGQSYEQLEAVARGRVWTGEQAKQHGLVDALGGLSEVLEALREELGLKPGSRLSLIDFNRQSLWQTLRARYLSDSIAHGIELNDARPLCLLPFQLEFF